MAPERAQVVAARLVEFLETGTAPNNLFTADVFCDFTFPRWRLQAHGVAATVVLRKQGIREQLHAGGVIAASEAEASGGRTNIGCYAFPGVIHV